MQIILDPAGSFILIETNQASEFQTMDASIYSLQGSLVKKVTLGIDNNSLDISDLKVGTYIIELTMGSEHYYRKFIKL